MARKIAGLATAILLTAAVVSAQVIDLSGEWDLQASAFLAQQPEEGLPDCEFSGNATITQDGADLGGTADLALVSGDPECPTEMSADLDGTINGTEIEMGVLMGGNLGTAEWTGAVVVGAAEGAGVGDLAGGFLAGTGPFAGSTGSWTAQRVGGPSVLAIPTLTTLGIVALVALLLAAAALILRRRPEPDSPSA